MKNCVGIPLRGSKLRAASRREVHCTLAYGIPEANGILLRTADALEGIAASFFSLASVKIILDNF
ncbi:MAG: hypothetical protein V7K48_21010 [Nostoc sp.]|uniref:hypothetical protein n=1 Tax=Nostoc sp. TaxID=1180 RepID=UPI002FF6BEBA